MAIVDLTFVKTYLGIADTTQDSKILLLIPKVEADYLIIRGVPFKPGPVYPIGSDITASEMIAYKLTKVFNMKEVYGNVTTNIKLDNYSETFSDINSDSILGYPKSIVSNIQRFIKGV